jgi:isopentenyl-diphosphate delta-isomerase type 1
MELVVLVDEQNHELGTRPKKDVHSTHTPLHRGFSLFLFNSKNEVLLTRRSHTKKTFPGLWTNTVCGHPGPGESNTDAAKRRLREELKIEGPEVKEVSNYRYRFADSNGIEENEICPILIAHGDANPKTNPDEVSAWKWVPWKIFLTEIAVNPKSYSPWSIEESAIIDNLHILDG